MQRGSLSAALIALVPLLAARFSAAEGAPSDAASRGPTTEVAVVDVDTLPRAELPTLPTEKDTPVGAAAWAKSTALSVRLVEKTPVVGRTEPRTGHLPMLSRKKKAAERTQIVELEPTAPSMDAIYASSPDATEIEASPALRMPCGQHESIAPLRWETLASPEGADVRLEVRDLFFDTKSCAVALGQVATLPLRAVAFAEGKPWLYAMRSRAGITLVMPRASELHSESMVGTAVSLRGAFTRITLPIGRWGSASVVAELDTLSFGPNDLATDDQDDRSVEVGIELVQTMSERSPTLLVRRSLRNPVSEGDTPSTSREQSME
jgi:hypothetical protein